MKVVLTQGRVALDEVVEISGLDFGPLIQEIDKLGLSPAAAPRGYTSQDSAGLWRGEGPSAYPDIPSFLLHSIVLRLIRSPSQEIDLEGVRREWLWGYTWDNNRPNDIFREWMRVACDMGWARHTGDGKRPRYAFIRREELRARLDAAQNWLTDQYPSVYQRLVDLLGNGQADAHFKPGFGSKFVAAEKHLRDAGVALDQLDSLEANPPIDCDLVSAQTWFIDASRQRQRANTMIARVFDKDRYEALEADLDLRYLQLLDEERPLWERVRLAEHFAHAVQVLSQRIRKRIPQLRDEIALESAGLHHFPVALFTRPLLKIDSIVDPGLTGEDPESTTQRVQHAKVNTLAWFLKELRVADAIEALRQLAKEVGLGERPADDKALPDIEGDVFRAWVDLRSRMTVARSSLVSLTGRILNLEDQFQASPSDLLLPPGASLEAVRGLPVLIEAQLDESLSDDVEDLLERHDEEMNMGQFGPLMREARQRLLDSAEQAIKGLEGRTRTLENAVQAYRQGLLDRQDLTEARQALDALRRAQAMEGIDPPTLEDLEPRSLAAGLQFIDATISQWAEAGSALLQPTGVSFETWCSVLSAVNDQTDPPVSQAEADALVTHGFLRRVYAVPGGYS
jgi:hypothetical protein